MVAFIVTLLGLIYSSFLQPSIQMGFACYSFALLFLCLLSGPWLFTGFAINPSSFFFLIWLSAIIWASPSIVALSFYVLHLSLAYAVSSIVWLRLPWFMWSFFTSIFMSCNFLWDALLSIILAIAVITN